LTTTNWLAVPLIVIPPLLLLKPFAAIVKTSLPVASSIPEDALMVWPDPEIVRAVPISPPRLVFSPLTVFRADVTAATLAVTAPVMVPPQVGPLEHVSASEKSRFP
jgi:hypothetical protein